MTKSSSLKKALMGLNILVIVGLAGATAYLFTENRDLNERANLTTEEINRRLVEEINEVFDLPDETPIVAIVDNAEEFKTEYSAFDNAEVGDYLLFFRKNRLNVLYRQSEKRVVKTADVAVPIAIELVGPQEALDAAESTLAQFGNQISITKRAETGITQSFVFDVDGDQSAEALSIADLLGVDVGSTLPATLEPAAPTEIVIALDGTVSAPATPAATESEEETPAQP